MINKETKNPKIRSDYEIDRNKKIYEEYSNTDASYNFLAKKYDLSPQRVQSIIKAYRDRITSVELLSTSSKEERERMKDVCVELRESGNLNKALIGFQSVLSWDKANSNLKGEKDVLGHIKITYTLLAEKSKATKDKEYYLNLAIDCIQRSIEIAPDDKVHLVHKASLLILHAEIIRGKEANEKLVEAVATIDNALQEFPGSSAHKSWPLSIKAKALLLLKKPAESLLTLREAEKLIQDGYDEETKTSDQGRIKLMVWLTGVYLGYAGVFVYNKNRLFAEYYANCIIHATDPNNVLTQRKKQAKKILKSLD